MDSRRNKISLAETYRKFVNSISPDVFFYAQIVITIFVGLLVLYFLSKRIVRRVSGRSILLIGGCEAGKTALFYFLTANKFPVTVTSFKENVGTYNSEKKSFRLVDVPGHERVRNTAFARHRSDARAIVFVLDSATEAVPLRDVAEQLFVLLTDPVVQQNCCPVAVVCNKQDKVNAKAASVIQRALTKEIEMLRETSSSRLASIGASDSSSTASLAKYGVPFDFSLLSRSTPVTFFETALTEPESLSKFVEWLETVP